MSSASLQLLILQNENLQKEGETSHIAFSCDLQACFNILTEKPSNKDTVTE